MKISPNRLLLVFLFLTALTACGDALPETVPPPPATVVLDVTVCAEGCDFPTIQAAIDAATVAPGTVIGVRDAVHTEAGILLHKAVTIQGLGVDRTIVQAHAILDGAPDRIFTVARGVTVTLRAMTIRHGNPRTSPESGGGILNEGALVIEDSVITANSGSAGVASTMTGRLPSSTAPSVRTSPVAAAIATLSVPPAAVSRTWRVRSRC